MSHTLTLIFLIIWVAILSSILSLLIRYLIANYRNAKSHQAPYIGSYARHLEWMKTCLSRYISPDTVIYDLGCGDGKALRFFARNWHVKNLIGYDLHPIAIRRWCILNWIERQTQIKLYQWDFMQVDLQNADIIYLFLLPAQLDSIREWLQKNMRSDTIIICNTFAFSDREPKYTHTSPDSRSTVMIYKK